MKNGSHDLTVLKTNNMPYIYTGMDKNIFAKNLTGINTERLSMKLLVEKDVHFIYELLNTEGWIKNIGNRHIHSEADALAYIQRIHGNPNITYWSVSLKENQKTIGLITLIQRDYLDFPDIGFAFLPAYFNKGYAYEATKKVLVELSANNMIENILAVILPANKSSVKLIEKLKLKFEKIIEENNQTLNLYKASKTMLM